MKTPSPLSLWFNFADYYDYVAKTLAPLASPVIAEVGVWKGDSVCHLASRLPHATVYAVDLWENTYRYRHLPKLQSQVPTVYESFASNVARWGVKNIKPVQGISWEVADSFEDESFDFVYIDADHSYEAVVKDIRAWLPKVKRGGFLAGHDYDNPKHPGVKTAVDELLGQIQTFDGWVWHHQRDA